MYKSMRNSVDAFLKLVKCYSDKNLVDDGLDYMYTFFDNQTITRKDFEYCDMIFESINPNDYKVDFLLGFLSITLPWKREFRCREDLYNRIENHLEKNYSKSILKGLK